MVNAIIIEDELKSRNNLKNFLSQCCTHVNVIGEAGSNAEGLELFNKHDKIDLAFLDISLPDGHVFKLLDKLGDIDFDIIFITAFEEFARKACNYSSIGYVMKPIDADELKEAVSRVHTEDKSNQIEKRLEIFKEYYNNPNSFSKMSIAALDGIYFVKLQDIVRFEAEDNYTHIFLKSGDKLTASKTIKSYEENLGHVNFYRVHKRHVVNLNYMNKFVKGDGGYLIMDDGIKIEVSRRRRPAFMERIRVLQGEI